MDFIPKSSWQWVFDKHSARLTLQMDDTSIELVYKSNMLVLPSLHPIAFTVEDVALYITLFESLDQQGYNAEFSCRIIVHMLAIELFHKPIVAKSWLFSPQQAGSSLHIELMSHVALTAKENQESAHYIVLDDGQEFVSCLLIDNVHQLTARKSLAQFQVVKVTVDKLTVIEPSDINNNFNH